MVAPCSTSVVLACQLMQLSVDKANDPSIILSFINYFYQQVKQSSFTEKENLTVFSILTKILLQPGLCFPISIAILKLLVLLLYCEDIELEGIKDATNVAQIPKNSPINPFSLEEFPSGLVLNECFHPIIFSLIYQQVHFIESEMLAGQIVHLHLFLRVLMFIPFLELEERDDFLAQVFPGVISILIKLLQLNSNKQDTNILIIKTIEVWITQLLNDPAISSSSEILSSSSSSSSSAPSSPFFKKLPSVILRNQSWLVTCQNKILPILVNLITNITTNTFFSHHLFLSFFSILTSCSIFVQPICFEGIKKFFSLYDKSYLLFGKVTSILIPYSALITNILENGICSVKDFFVTTEKIDSNVDEFLQRELHLIRSTMEFLIFSDIKIPSNCLSELLLLISSYFDLFINERNSAIDVCFHLKAYLTFSSCSSLVFAILDLILQGTSCLQVDQLTPLILYSITNSSNKALLQSCMSLISHNLKDYLSIVEPLSLAPVYLFYPETKSLMIPSIDLMKTENLFLISSDLQNCKDIFTSNCSTQYNRVIATLTLFLSCTEPSTDLLSLFIPKLLLFWGLASSSSSSLSSSYHLVLSKISHSILCKLVSSQGFSSDIIGISGYLAENCHLLLNSFLSPSEVDNLGLVSMLKPLCSSFYFLTNIIIPNVPMIDKLLSILEEHQDDPILVKEYLNLFLIAANCISSTEPEGSSLPSLGVEDPYKFLNEHFSQIDEPLVDKNYDDRDGIQQSAGTIAIENFLFLSLPVISNFMCHDCDNIKLHSYQTITSFFCYFSRRYRQNTAIKTPFELPYAKKLFPLVHSKIWPFVSASLVHINNPVVFIAALNLLDALSSTCYTFVKDKMRPIIKNLVRSLVTAITRLENKAIPSIDDDKEENRLKLLLVTAPLAGNLSYLESTSLEMISSLLEKLSRFIVFIELGDERDLILNLVKILKCPFFNNLKFSIKAPNLVKNQVKLMDSIELLAPHLMYYATVYQ